jgi:hypothetical protein
MSKEHATHGVNDLNAPPAPHPVGEGQHVSGAHHADAGGAPHGGSPQTAAPVGAPGQRQASPGVAPQAAPGQAPEMKPSSLGVPAFKTQPVPPGGVDIHKMDESAPPTHDGTRGRKPEPPKPLAVMSASGEDAAAQPSDVSDDDLLLCCGSEQEHDSPKKATMGSLSVGATAIPWSIILAMLERIGLPIVMPSIQKLRDRVSAANWPEFIKRPILAALDAIISNPEGFAEHFQHAATVNDAE